MPSSSPAQHSLMTKWFGSFDDRGPYQFLRARGWTEKAGMFTKPTPSHTTSAYELECLKFLRDEWDYDWHAPSNLFFTDVYRDAHINIMTGEVDA